MRGPSETLIEPKKTSTLIGVSTELEKPTQILADFSIEWIDSMTDLNKLSLKNNILQTLKGMKIIIGYNFLMLIQLA